MNLDNRTAVIVGGTGDIGHSTARLFIEAGANVIITGRTATRVKEKASALGPKARGIAVDPADESQLRRLFAESGAFDYLLLTLGTQAVTMSFVELSEEELLRAMNEKFLFYTRTLRLAWDKVGQSVTWLIGAAARTALPCHHGTADDGAPAGPHQLRGLRIGAIGFLAKSWNASRGAGCDVCRRGAIDSAAPCRRAQEIAHALLFAATNSYTTRHHSRARRRASPWNGRRRPNRETFLWKRCVIR
jgi:NAD(P)-dependent dehydrogenase (short-subunit alcohol dehydrogenase family)